MPRKTRLALVGERSVAPDLDAVAAADAALAQAEIDAHPLVPPADIVAVLRSQVAETARIANQAFEDANQQRARADSLEAALSGTRAEAIAEKTRMMVETEAVRAQAADAVVAVQKRAEAATVLARRVEATQVVAQRFGQAIGFLVDRAPVLLSLAGAFVLAQAMLPRPDVLQLADLAIYGAVAVAPAAWLSLRRQ